MHGMEIKVTDMLDRNLSSEKKLSYLGYDAHSWMLN
jgi:hypothetical protein